MKYHVRYEMNCSLIFTFSNFIKASLKLFFVFSNICYADFSNSKKHAEPDQKKEKGEITKEFLLSSSDNKNLTKEIDQDDYLLDPDDQQCYHLAGILFLNQKQWYIWMNHKSYTNQDVFSNFKILKVETDGILVQTLSKKVKSKKKRFLRFNQTYCPETDEIFQGDYQSNKTS